MLDRTRKSMGAALALLLSLATTGADAGAPTQATIGVDRTVNPSVLCIASAGACVGTIGTLSGGTFTPAGLAAEITRAQGAESSNAAAIATEASTARNASNLTVGVVPVGVLPTGINPGTVAAGCATATGATTCRDAGTRAADVLNVMDFGAKCDGSTDDSAAINAASNYGRNNLVVNGSPHFKLLFPQGKACVVQSSTINLTEFSARGLEVEGSGSQIICRTTGKPCIDMMGSAWTRLRDLDVYGDPNNIPSIGIQIGRSTGGSANNVWENVQVRGVWSFTALYQLSTETSSFYGLKLFNDYNAGAYNACFALVQDGINHWKASSTYTTVTMAVDTYHSFNEDFYAGAQVQTSYGCTPIWSANTRRHNWVAGYVASGTGAAQTPAASPYAVILWSHDSTDATTMLSMDVHFETGALTDVFFVTGTNAAPTLHGIRLREHFSSASSSVFRADTSVVTSIAANDVDLDFNAMSGTEVLFAQPALWTVSGHYALPAGSTAFNLPVTSFSGFGTLGSTAYHYGDGSNLANIVANLPSSLTFSQATNTGGVSGVTVTNGAHYNIEAWCFHDGTNCQSAYAHKFPTITIGSPGSGGSQATAAVTAVSFSTNTVLDGYLGDANGFKPSNGGTGYSTNDVLTMQGGTCSTPPKVRVYSQSGGVITEVTASTPGSCSVVPPEPISLSGGTGSGATLSGLTWVVTAAAPVAQGSGYGSVPPATFQTSSFNNVAASGTASVSATMTLTAGAGQLLLDTVGTKTGTSGTSGRPTISLGALIDGSGVRQALTASGYTVPANTSLVRFTETAAVTAPITLPAALADGQPVQFVNQGTAGTAGAITATFSPAIQGYPNPVTVAALSGLRIRWDATAAAWEREQ